MTKNGFSLVEVMVAMVILMFGVLAIAPMFVMASKENGAAADMGHVGVIAVSKMEELRATSFNQLIDGDYTDNSGTVQLAWHIGPLNGVEVSTTPELPEEPAWCDELADLLIQSHSGFGITVQGSLGTCPTFWYPEGGHESCQWVVRGHDMHLPFTATVTVNNCLPNEGTFLMDHVTGDRRGGASCSGNGVPFEVRYIPEYYGCIHHEDSVASSDASKKYIAVTVTAKRAVLGKPKQVKMQTVRNP